MASAEQVKALLKSYSEGNGEHFVSVALQIAADVVRQERARSPKSCAISLIKLSSDRRRGRQGARSRSRDRLATSPASLAPLIRKRDLRKWC